jgi:hypothetical protein
VHEQLACDCVDCVVATALVHSVVQYTGIVEDAVHGFRLCTLDACDIIMYVRTAAMACSLRVQVLVVCGVSVSTGNACGPVWQMGC